jgi:hypothetical protein
MTLEHSIAPNPQRVFVELMKGENFDSYPYRVRSVILNQTKVHPIYPFRREIYWPVISPNALKMKTGILGRRETFPFVIMYGLLPEDEKDQAILPVLNPILDWGLCSAGKSSPQEAAEQAERAVYQYALNQAKRLEVPENWQLIINDKIAHSRRVIPYSETECAKEKKRIELSGRLRTNSD